MCARTCAWVCVSVHVCLHMHMCVYVFLYFLYLRGRAVSVCLENLFCDSCVTVRVCVCVCV